MEYCAVDLTDQNIEEWNNFLRKQSCHNPFQSGVLFLSLQHNQYYKPFGRIVRPPKNDTILGGYVFYRSQEMPGLFSFLTSRIILNGGPILSLSDPELLRFVLNDILQHPDMKGVYLELWNDRSWQSQMTVFEQAGFEFIPHLNYFIDLALGEKVIQKNINPRKWRYIRRNEKELQIREVETEKDLETCYQLFKNTYQRVKLPLPKRNIFEEVNRTKAGFMILAEKEGEPVAARAVLRFNSGIYDWYAGDSPEHRNLHANESLVWWILRNGCIQGDELFNFGGAGKPDVPYGPRDFKSAFNGELVNYGRFRKVLSPMKYTFLKAILGIRSIITG